MHRHGVQQRKLSRPRNQREALVRGQLTSLVLHEAIVTTEAKAKTVAPEFDKLVTRAKRADLAAARVIRAILTTENAVAKLQTELVPAFAERTSGYTRQVKLEPRLGDGAAMVQLSLVLPAAKPAAAATEAKEKETVK